ncbi:MAG: hypothetical protein HYZ89_04940, partial [Candidatus Omnitrophica bacterium]|nr:hypothetical protein [Candidatus Omnitrophota bacterium]
HRPTIPNELLNFAAAPSATNTVTFGFENKLQTRRARAGGKPQSVDLARSQISLPYTYRGTSNKQGGRLGDWAFDFELYPWPWLRFQTDWTVPSHFDKATRDERIPRWNVDLIMVGGEQEPQASTPNRPEIQAPPPRPFAAGPKGGFELLMPQGAWYLGLGHRYSQNDKTEEVIQFDWRLSKKWEVNTFHRFTLKEVSGGSKRFNNLREYQYNLRRDLHDWLAELVYRVDREFGEELLFTLTLKAYPDLPIDFGSSYHEPKIGSQSGPFSPLRGQNPGP